MTFELTAPADLLHPVGCVLARTACPAAKVRASTHPTAR
jgi:hypothetical protein